MHCAATGSHCGGEETFEEAAEKAKANWNEAERPNQVYHTIKLIVTTVYNDVIHLISNIVKIEDDNYER